MAKSVRPDPEAEADAGQTTADDAPTAFDGSDAMTDDGKPALLPGDDSIDPAADPATTGLGDDARAAPWTLSPAVEKDTKPDDDFANTVEASEILETLREDTPSSQDSIAIMDAEVVEEDRTAPNLPPAAAVPQEKPAAPPAAKAKSGGGFIGTVFGGLVAAGIGYALASYGPAAGLLPAPPASPEEVAAQQALAARIDALEGTGLADRIAALEQRPAPPEPDLAPLTTALAEVQARVADLAGLDARLAALEAAGPVTTSEGVPADLLATINALRAEMDVLKSAEGDARAGVLAMVDEAKAQIAEAEATAAALKADSEAAARLALASAAVSRLTAALESGSPYADALPDLAGYEVPAILVASAEAGVPSPTALVAAFPEAARAALDASIRSTMGDSWSDRAASFLQSATGARSLTPQEGDGPDAVLSRAEAATKAGDLQTALTELQALPDAGKTAMAEWSAMAQHRLDAANAIAALAAAVEG